MPHLDNKESQEARQIAQKKCIREIKQKIVDSLRDVRYDVVSGDWYEVESKLSTAYKYLEAWRKKKIMNGMLGENKPAKVF